MRPSPTSRRRRPPPSPHGLLFGGDALYQVLVELAKNAGQDFTTAALAARIRRTPEHTRHEIKKLIAVGVVEEVRRDRKLCFYKVNDNQLARDLLELPAALVERLGKYQRPEATAERE